MTRPERARRWARQMLFAASLLLMLLSLAGWIRSRWVGDEFMRQWNRALGEWATHHGIGFAHGGGDFCFFLLDAEQPAPSVRSPRVAWIYYARMPTPVHYNLGGPVRGAWGYGWSSWVYAPAGAGKLSGSVRAIVLPYWLAMLCGAVVPGWWAFGYKRRLIARRRAAGCCMNCGYDLRGSPGRCPECGAISPDRC